MAFACDRLRSLANPPQRTHCEMPFLSFFALCKICHNTGAPVGPPEIRFANNNKKHYATNLHPHFILIIRGHPFSRVVVRCSVKDILRENPLHSLQKSDCPSVAEFLPFVPRHAANITGPSGMQWLPLLPGAAARPLAPG